MRSIIEDFKKGLTEKIGNKTIIEWSRYLSIKNSNSFSVDHPGLLFKLFSLYSYLLYPYLPIMRSWRSDKPEQSRLIYLDPFAGNGLNKIHHNDLKHFICGSSVLTLLTSQKLTYIRKKDFSFDQMILIDKSKDKIMLLSDRLDILIKDLDLQDYVICHKLDLNSKIITISQDVTRKSFVIDLVNHINNIWSQFPRINIMFFIDPDTPSSLTAFLLNNLLSFPGDVIMLLHSGIFAEMVNKKRYSENKLIDMLGYDKHQVKDLYKKTNNPQDLEKIYVDRYEQIIKNIEIKRITSGSNKRDIIKKVPIKTKSRNYILLYATRKTGGRDYKTWQREFEKLANDIGKLSDTGNLALNVLSGEQQQISFFFR